MIRAGCIHYLLRSFFFYPQASESPHKGSISILRLPIGQFPTPLFISLFPLQSKLVRKMAAHESGDLERRAIGPPLGSGEGILKQKDARSFKAGHQLVRHLERFNRVMWKLHDYLLSNERQTHRREKHNTKGAR